MNDGMRTKATAIPFAKPTTAAGRSAKRIAAPVDQWWYAITDTLAADAIPTTLPSERSNSPITSTSVAPTARQVATDASSRIACMLDHVRKTLGFAIEKKANAPANASSRLQRSATTRAERYRDAAARRQRLGASASAATVSVKRVERLPARLRV